MLYQITDIEFDLTLDDEDAWELDDPELLQKQLQDGYIGQIFDLDVENPHDDDEVVEELLEEISAQSGWCIKSLNYRHILK